MKIETKSIQRVHHSPYSYCVLVLTDFLDTAGGAHTQEDPGQLLGLGYSSLILISSQPCRKEYIVLGVRKKIQGIEELVAPLLSTQVWELNNAGVPRPLLLNLLVYNGSFNSHSIR